LWKKRLAAAASRRAASRKSIVAPAESTARYRVGPLALHPNVGLIDPPGAIGRFQFPTTTLVQFGRIALDPSPDAGVVSWQASLGEKLLDVTIRERKSQVPPNCTGDHRGFEVSPFEQGWP